MRTFRISLRIDSNAYIYIYILYNNVGPIYVIPMMGQHGRNYSINRTKELLAGNLAFLSSVARKSLQKTNIEGISLSISVIKDVKMG